MRSATETRTLEQFIERNRDELVRFITAFVTALGGDQTDAAVAKDRLFVNDTRTVLARLWANGRVEVARRDSQYDTWGPPVMLDEERA